MRHVAQMETQHDQGWGSWTVYRVLVCRSVAVVEQSPSVLHMQCRWNSLLEFAVMRKDRVTWNSYSPARQLRWHAPYWQELAAAAILGFIVAWIVS